MTKVTSHTLTGTGKSPVTSFWRIFISVFCLLSSVFCFSSYASVVGDNRQGNELYKQEKYEEAMKMYKKAEEKKPSLAEIHYNIGNTFYQQKEYARASEEYGSALSLVQPKQGIFSSQVHYNIGNCKYRLKNMQGAIDSYKKTLGLNSQDKDAQYNINFVKKLLKEKQKENSEKREKGSGKREEKSGKREAGSGEEEKGKGEREKKEQKRQFSSYADVLLDSLDKDEKEVQRIVKQRFFGQGIEVKEDW